MTDKDRISTPTYQLWKRRNNSGNRRKSNDTRRVHSSDNYSASNSRYPATISHLSTA